MAGLELDELRQGDVLRGGRVFFQGEQMLCLTQPKRRYRIVEDDPRKTKQYWIMPAVASDLIILTQSCDVRRTDTLVLAPVRRIEVGLNPNSIPNVKAQRITHHYHLPKLSDPSGVLYPESYVDATITCTLTRNVIKSLEIVRRMEPNRREQFRKFILNHFGRPALEDDIVDAFPQFKDVARSKIHKQIHSVWINASIKHCSLLVVLNESSPGAVDMLKNAINEDNKLSTSYTFALECRTLSNTTLSDLQSYTRISFDEVSLGKRSDFMSADLDI